MWNKLLIYLYLKKPTGSAKGNINLKLMHGVNRISILLFILALVVMLFRYVL